MPAVAFHDVQFPPNISYGATGGPAYRTTIIQTASGHEQRLAEWDETLMKWNVGAQIWDQARLDSLLAFFHARQGRAYAFRFKDWSDYFVGYRYTNNALVVDTATSQQFATGDGATKTFQLTKSYVSGGVTRVRRITRPIAGTVKLYFGATEQTTGWTLDASTGKVTFTTAPPNGTVLKWVGQFDVPARFDSDEMNLSLEAIQIGNWPSIAIVGIRE